jgi:TP901 family phage tail tape measure protein
MVDVPIRIKLKAIDKLTKVFEKATSSMKKLKKATKSASDSFTNFKNKTKKMRESLSKVGGKVKNVGKSLTAGLTLPIVGVGASIIKTAANFEKSMNKVQALTNANTTDFEKMRKKARELGATTQFSASQAADAMSFLGMAGFDANKILAATPAILDLAAASGTDLARTADITSNIMGGFGLEAKDTGRIADVLAAATASANVDMEMLAETMKEAAPIGKQFGATLEDTVSASALLGNIGIQGSKAGTALKNAFNNLASPAGKAAKVLKGLGIQVADGDGKMFRFQDIMAKLGGQLQKLPQKARLQALNAIFGKIGIAAASNLQEMAQAGKLQEFSNSMLHVKNRAKEMAETMNKGATGGVKQLMSAMEDLALSIADSGVLQMFTKIVGKITNFVREISTTSPELLKFGSIVAIAVAALGPLLVVFGGIIAALPAMVTGFGILATAIGAISLPVVAVIAGITALGALAFTIIKNWDTVSVFFSSLWEGIKQMFTDAATFVGNKMDELLGFIPDFIKTKIGITPEIEDKNLKRNRRGLRDKTPLPDNVRNIRGRSAKLFEKAKAQSEDLKKTSIIKPLPEIAKLKPETQIKQNLAELSKPKDIKKPADSNIKSENKVMVDFQNVPRGTKIKTESDDKSQFDVNTGVLGL